LNTARDFPAPVSTGTIFLAVSAGGRHSCALAATSAVYCWGDNTNGQVGVGLPPGIVSTPSAVPGTYIAISAGDHHTCALATGGQLVCWGGSDFGQVGDGNPNAHDIASPQLVQGSFQATAITAGFRHTCAVRASDGQTLCWGSNMFGALGNELQAAVRATPQLVAKPR
jgi:alpha-tubulin suppressor-like RCC1 family protein